MSNEGSCAWRARWVVPVVGEPIEHGVVTVRGGRIAHVGRTSDSAIEDLGDVVLLPGLINAHTHLEFSDLTQPLGQPGQVFPRWISDVIQWRRGRTADPRRAVEQGLDQSTRCGVAAIGEIATGVTWDQTFSPALDTTVFYEAICLQSARVAEVLGGVDAFLDQRSSSATWRAGLSPHAPYTVHPELLAALVTRACARQLPLAMHLAESREELELLAHGTGPFRELLDSVGIVWPRVELSSFRRPLDYLRVLAQTPRTLVIHGNYLADDEIAFLATQRERLTVVYCPRTHAYFGHDRYPLAKLLDHGVSMAIGTDGRGSNPDLSVLGELRHVAEAHPEVSPRRILELGTIDGARALDCGAELGSIEVGKRARFCTVRCGDSPQNDPYAIILHGTGEPVA